MATIFSGALVGGVYGFKFGGVFGAFAGAILGGVLGWGIQSSMSESNIGAPPIQDLSVTSCEEGLSVQDVLGTTKVVGNLLWFGNESVLQETEEQEVGGKGGGGTQTVVTGYKYYMSWVVGLSIGEVDELLTIYNGDEVVWEGSVTKTLEEEAVTIDDMGTMYFFFGTSTQLGKSKIAGYLPDSTLNPSYRNQCYAFFDTCYIGSNNRCPTMHFVIRKTPSFSFNSNHRIGDYGYNPAHMLWYIAVNLVGLDETEMMNADSFSDAADTLSDEGFELNLLFDTSRPAKDYMQEILKHIDGILDYRDGLYLKLVRKDIDGDDVPEISIDEFRDKPTIERSSWTDTVNEIKIKYPLRYDRN